MHIIAPTQYTSVRVIPNPRPQVKPFSRGKSAEAAEEAKQIGNKSFQQKKYRLAVLQYSRMVIRAPAPSSGEGGESLLHSASPSGYRRTSGVSFRVACCVVASKTQKGRMKKDNVSRYHSYIRPGHCCTVPFDEWFCWFQILVAVVQTP